MQLKLFSVDEANRLISTLEPLLAALVAKKAELLAKQAELEAFLKGSRTEGPHARGGAARLDSLILGKEELKFIAEEFNVSLHELSSLGCLVKDIDAGLVDFPSIRNGREVFLCWRRGESRVGYWHSIEEGFAGRKPIETLAGFALESPGAAGASVDADGDQVGPGTTH